MIHRRYRLPPLNALRAFAAAGRHQSYTAAAQELHVTAGAISRQIKQLETHVGILLFTRANRTVTLTLQGRSYHTTVCSILNRIEAGTNRLIGSSGLGRPLQIVCPMTLALLWLTPKLRSFHERFPGQQFRITTTLAPLDNLPHGSDVDIAFQLSKAPARGWISHPVMASRLSLVCSPKLIAPRSRIKSLDELADFTLLRSNLQMIQRPGAWELLTAEARGLDLAKVRAIEFPSSGLALQAAVAGRGFALGEAAFIKEDLERGALICPFQKTIATGYHYYMVYAAESARDKRIADFKSWLLSAVKVP